MEKVMLGVSLYPEQEALEEICILIEKTEEKVVSYYEEEQQKPQFTRFTIRYNQELLLNPHIQELAPIRLKNEGEADE